MDLREVIQSSRMTRFQWSVVGICIFFTIIDGYEILVTAYTLPDLSKTWGLDVGQQGLVASIGILGMGIGATLLSPIADRLGRRRHILVSLALIILGMTLSGLAPNFEAFLACRLFAGLFLGGIVASVNVLVAEYASGERRGMVMGIYGVGFPLGAAIGGFLSIWMINAFGWRGPFLFAAAATAVLFVWAQAALPESVSYLVEARPAGALERYNAIARRIGVAPAAALPAAAVSKAAKSFKGAVEGIMLRRTLLLWVGYSLLIGAFYFANSFTVKLVAESTGNEDIGISAQALIGVGGVIGALFFAAASLRRHPLVVTTCLLLIGTVVFFLFANFFTSTSIVLVLAVLVGFAVNGGVAAFYAISPPIYPTAIRASSVGLMMGIGRIVAFLAPNIAAFLLGHGFSAPEVFEIYGVVLAVAAAAIFLLHRTYRGANSLDAMQQEALDAADAASTGKDRLAAA